MERGFESSYFTGEEASDSNYNAVFSDGTLQSLVPKSTYSPSSSFNFFSQPFPALTLTHNHKFQQLNNQPYNDPTFELTQPFDFLSKPTPLSHSHSVSPFNHLPDLHSLELLTDSSSSTHKRPRVDSPHTTLDSILSRPLIPHSDLARQRRQKISEKTRCLQKLMPWDKKMDTATMLEEAYKYVHFLQAQISALQSMPCDSSFTTQNDGRFVTALGRLNRQQLLQVMVNSPAPQTMLYSQGFCVFSMEQLVSLKKAAARRAVLQQFLGHDPSRRS